MKIKPTRALSLVLGVIIGLVIAFSASTAVFAVVMNPPVVTSPEATAQQFDLTVAWYETKSPCGSKSETIGCFQTKTPTVVYIKRGMDAQLEHYAVLHEIGHAVAHRLNLPVDECKADRFAQSLGSDIGSYCPPVD